MTDDNLIEVEVRGLLSKEKWLNLVSYLKQHSNKYEDDNKLSYFFVISNGILKVNDEITKKTAKIVYKYGDESKNILDEYEITINKKDVSKAVDMFVKLGYENVNKVPQKRINFKYKDAVFSLKDTPDFGPHFEIEKKAKNKSDAIKKRVELKQMCKDLGIVPMSPKQIRDLIVKVNNDHGFIKAKIQQ